MIAAHLGWLVIVCLLVAWWGRLLLRQAGRIVELERSLGISAGEAQDHWHRVQRMLYWESSAFFALLLVSSVFLFWYYWRDVKRAKGLHAFFASVTHELRTPLTSIRLQAESIADQDERQGKHVQRLIEDTIRLESQVERTLELARVEGGGPVYTQIVQLKPWLDRFVSQWSAHFNGRVKFDVSVDDVLIEADPSAMHVIFKNLLENSLKHSQAHSEPEYSEVNPIRVEILTENQNQGIVLRVLDHGNGYPGDSRELGRIFHKGPRSQGTGVGLYLVKVLMKKMGGWAEFNGSQEGFWVSLWFREGRQNG